MQLSISWLKMQCCMEVELFNHTSRKLVVFEFCQVDTNWLLLIQFLTIKTIERKYTEGYLPLQGYKSVSVQFQTVNNLKTQYSQLILVAAALYQALLSISGYFIISAQCYLTSNSS